MATAGPIRGRGDRRSDTRPCAVRDQAQCFPDEATIRDWSPSDRSKMLRRLEQIIGEHAEALMRVLLQLDAVETEVRPFVASGAAQVGITTGALTSCEPPFSPHHAGPFVCRPTRTGGSGRRASIRSRRRFTRPMIFSKKCA